MSEANLWLFSWISPRHVVAVTSLVLLPVLQCVTCAMAYCAQKRWFEGPSAATGVDPYRWSRIGLAALLPLAVLVAAARWIGMPRASLAVEASLWPAWLGLGGGIATVGLASWLTLSRVRIRDVTKWTLGAGGGFVAIVCWALIVSFQLAPGAWLEKRTIQLAVQPPNFLPILCVYLLSTLALGTAIVLSQTPQSTHRWPSALAAISSGLGCVLLVSAPWWLSADVMLITARDTLEQGQGGVPWATRWTLVAMVTWAAYGLTARLGPSFIDRRAWMFLAALAACSSQSIWVSYRGPWAIRGWMYENGVDVERVRTSRRTTLSEGNESSRVGWVFTRQCATCHASSGPLSNWRTGLPCDTVEVRRRLEALREADRIGHPDVDRMPPLLGSDAEIDALARWLRDGVDCTPTTRRE